MSNRFSISSPFGKLSKLPKLSSLTKSGDKPNTPEHRDATTQLPAPVDTGVQPDAHQTGDNAWTQLPTPRGARSDRAFGQQRKQPDAATSPRFHAPSHSSTLMGTPRHKASGYRAPDHAVYDHPLYDLSAHPAQDIELDTAATDASVTAQETDPPQTNISNTSLADLSASEQISLLSESADAVPLPEPVETEQAPADEKPPADEKAPVASDSPGTELSAQQQTRLKRFKQLKKQEKRTELQAKPEETPSDLRQSLYTGHLHTNAQIERHLGPRNHHYSFLLGKRIAAAAKSHDPRLLLALMEQLNRGGDTVLRSEAERTQLLKPLMALCTDPGLSAEDRLAVYTATLPMLPKPQEFEDADLLQDVCFSMVIGLEDPQQRQAWWSMYQQAMTSPRVYAEPASE